jgi:hypothetical protein
MTITINKQNTINKQMTNKQMTINLEAINNTSLFNDTSKKKKNKTQPEYYLENNSPENIMKLVMMSSATFGAAIDTIITEFFELDKRTDSGHDKKINDKKIEIKSSRFWGGKQDWRWQHMMENHQYDYLILNGLEFDGISSYIISKDDIFKLKSQNLLTQQGGGEGQGYWCLYSNIKDYLHKITDKNDILNFIK